MCRNLLKLVCQEVASECGQPKLKVAIASAKTVAAVERLVQADRRLAATTEQWDLDPFALNTPAGILDLRSGQLSASDPLAYCTKMTGVAPRGTLVARSAKPWQRDGRCQRQHATGSRGRVLSEHPDTAPRADQAPPRAASDPHRSSAGETLSLEHD